MKLVETLLSTPTLINPGEFSDGNGNSRNQGLPFAIPLETESNSQTGSAEVSESIVITKDVKKNMTDNIAPGSWTWNLTGYIPGITALEPTNFFTPFVQLNTALLKNAFKKGYTLIYKDMDASIYKRVAIQSLTIDPQADCRNKTPFSMTLKEINVAEVSAATSTETELKSTPAVGNLKGDALLAGSTVAVSVFSGLEGISKIFGGTGITRTYKNAEQIPWPDMDIQDNFEFNSSCSAGTFTFHFKWMNGRWNCWATLPDDTVREAMVYPNVVNWSGRSDFGIAFKTDLKEVKRDSLLMTEIYLVTWE